MCTDNSEIFESHWNNMWKGELFEKAKYLESTFIPKLYSLYEFLDSPFFLRQVSIEISLGTASQYTEMCFTKISFGDRFLNIFTFWCSSSLSFLLLQGVLCLRCFLRIWKNNRVSRKPCKRRSDLVLNGKMRVPKSTVLFRKMCC